MINCGQLRDLIIVPSLSAIGLLSQDAVQLLLMTAATESNLGEYVRQQGMIMNNGAFGIYQTEKRTYDGIYDTLITGNVAMKAKLQLYLGYVGKPQVQRLMSDLALATIITRLFYYNINQPLPSKDDVLGMAKYYKAFYNTILGSNTEEKAIADYQRLVK
jgi:hypothetical protein